jgi:nucleoside-diphosphate-sugar epimerase
MTQSQSETLLITGGAGYIGSVLTGQALATGYRVRALDCFRFGGESLLAWQGHPNLEIVKGDITHAEDVVSAVDGATMIVHLAAIVGDPACQSEPELAAQVNRDGSIFLFETARTRGVKRFVFASTCSNYGRMENSDGWVDESSELRPISLYARTKVEFEKHLLEQDTELCRTVLRFATAYGLSPRPRFDLTVNEFTRDLVTGRRLEVFGEQFWRPYCHTRDLAAACLAVLNADSRAVDKEAFNVGSDSENYQKRTLIQLILNQVPEAAGLVEYVRRDEDPRDYRVRFGKIRGTLGFRPAMTVPDGIGEIGLAVREGWIRDPYRSIYRNCQ